MSLPKFIVRLLPERRERSSFGTRWFVEPRGTRCEELNAIIAGELPAENAHFGIRDDDGTPRNLWECSRRFITALKGVAREQNLEFRVFLEQSTGDIVPWGPREPRPTPKRREARE